MLLGVWQILLCYAFNKNLSAIQWRQNGAASYAMHGVMKKSLLRKSLLQIWEMLSTIMGHEASASSKACCIRGESPMVWRH